MPAETRITVRGAELSAVVAGDGPLFVWGHGLLGSVAQESDTGLFGWPDAAEVVRLVRYDARGHGRSSAASDPDELRWSELAGDLWALVDELGGGRPILGGTSMGSATALHAAAARPDDVRALVLALPPTAWATRRRQRTTYRIASPLVRATGTALLSLGARAAARPKLLTGDLSPVGDALTDHVGRNPRRRAAAALAGASRSDLPAEATLRRLRTPTLILSWAGDPTHPRSTAERLDSLLPDAEWHHATEPDEVLAWPRLVTEFVRRAARADRGTTG